MERNFTIKAEVELKGEPPDVQRAQAAIIDTINSPMWRQQLENRLLESGELEHEVEIRRVMAQDGSIEVIIAAVVTVYGIMGFFATLEDTIAFVERVSQSQIADTVEQNIQHYGGRVSVGFQKIVSEIKGVKPTTILIGALGLACSLIFILVIALIWMAGFSSGQAAPTRDEPTFAGEVPSTEQAETILPSLTPLTTDSPTATLTPSPNLDPALFLAESKSIETNDDWIYAPYTNTFDDGVEMALVPAGCFELGSQFGDPDEQPVRTICFEQPFWLDVYEVTNSQFGSASANCPSMVTDPQHPHVCISWLDAKNHCESRNARLPTEAEWEYAARGPDNLLYPWGNDFISDNVVWLNTSGRQSNPVGNRQDGESWAGVHDLSGNVWEWVNDWYDPNYYGTLVNGTINPQGPQNGQYRVIRGGSWLSPDIDLLGTTYRNFDWMNPQYEDTGFRCARTYERG